MKSALHALKFGLTALSLTCLFNTASSASVVMTGTRVIFPANQNEKNVHLQNKDNTPNIVQVWLDKGNEASTPDTADAPFIANPQIFKIAPNQGQMVRLVFTGDKSTLPADRESIFYMNFSEIPASKNADADKNKLMVVFKNRVKVLYRPDRLAIPSHEMANHIHYQFTGSAAASSIKVTNNSPYYANAAEINLITAGKKTVIQKNTMLAPFSAAEWPVPVKNINATNAKVNIALINDYGIVNNSELTSQME